MARIVFLFLACYFLLVLVIYIFQRHLQYFPNRDNPGTPAAAGVPQMSSVEVETSDGLSLVGWFAPPRQPEGKIVILFHGNAGNISHRAIKAAHLMDHGYGVYLAEYRGYGGNAGSPSEAGFYKDAEAALSWVEGQGYSPAQFVIYGESIGTGVAVEMALRWHPHYLILEAPFTSAMDVARLSYYWLPVNLLMRDRFDSLSKISKIKSRLLIVHGDEDGVIPIGFANKLYESANHPKEFVTINGGAHSDLYDHHAGHIIPEWLDKAVKE